MKGKLLIMVFGCMLLTASAWAGFTMSGDSELNSALSSLNGTATLNFPEFKAEIRVSYNITEAKIDYLTTVIKMEPADVYMTVELALIANTSVDKVATVYQANKGKGWGRIAQELGIKPGSKEFKALKGKALGHTEKIKGHAKGNGKDKPKNK